MKSVLVGSVVFATAFSFTEMAWGDISAQARVAIAGQFPLISENQLEFGQFSAGTDSLEISRETEFGFATARAGATGSHFEKRIVGLSVGGTANISKPDHAPGETGFLDVSGEAVVDFTDELLFNFVPTSPNQVRIGGFFNLDGIMNVTATDMGPDMNASAAIFVDITGPGLTPASLHADTLGLPTLNKTVGQVSLFTFDVSSGVPKPISFRMRLVGKANVTGPQTGGGPARSGVAAFTADFSHSLSWGGITSVVNLGTGEPITNWSVTSESGFDYSQVFPPVPEPSSIALLSFGLCVWLGRARRRGWRG